jgi:hypothetical protein
MGLYLFQLEFPMKKKKVEKDTKLIMKTSYFGTKEWLTNWLSRPLNQFLHIAAEENVRIELRVFFIFQTVAY